MFVYVVKFFINFSPSLPSAGFISTMYPRSLPLRSPIGIGLHWMLREVEVRFQAFKLWGGALGAEKTVGDVVTN